jgi:hypothetical protein
MEAAFSAGARAERAWLWVPGSQSAPGRRYHMYARTRVRAYG